MEWPLVCRLGAKFGRRRRLVMDGRVGVVPLPGNQFSFGHGTRRFVLFLSSAMAVAPPSARNRRRQ